MPKLKMTIFQYLWCWIVLILVFNTPVANTIGITGLWKHLYYGSISLIAISMLLKYGGKTYLVFCLSSLEILAVTLQIGTCYANLVKEANWFHSNYRQSTQDLFDLEVLLLTISGIYGFGLLLWRTYNSVSRNRGGNSFKSVIYSLLFKERRGQQQ